MRIDLVEDVRSLREGMTIAEVRDGGLTLARQGALR
jgi:hypothetical protein